MNSFYTQEELLNLGFKSIGNGVLISKKASFYGSKDIIIGNHVRIDDFCVLSGKISIGNHVHIAAACCLFGGKAGIRVCDYAGISSRSALYAESDDYSGGAMTNPTIPDKYRLVSGGEIVLNKHALIGTGSTILPGVVVGEGTAVGSMSLVTRSLDPWSIYVGIPCEKKKERKKDILQLEHAFINSKQGE